MLQILDDGKLTDAQGRTVNFENTVIIMTTNATAGAMNATGFNRDAGGIGIGKGNESVAYVPASRVYKSC